MTNRSYQSRGELCMNAGEQFCSKRNFAYQLAKYRQLSRIFCEVPKIRRNIALCSSELSPETPRIFSRTFLARTNNEIRAFRLHYFEKEQEDPVKTENNFCKVVDRELKTTPSPTPQKGKR